MLQKIIKVGDKEVAFRSSATIPRLYRMKFKRDIFKVMQIHTTLINRSYSVHISSGVAMYLKLVCGRVLQIFKQ